MKKKITLLLAAVLALGTLVTGCGDTEENTAVKVGVGVHTDYAYGSYDIGATVNGVVTETGKAQADITAAAVMLDEEGKIVDVVIDAVQVYANIDGTGAIVTDLNETYLTKKEKGDDYGMVKYNASPIGKEWYEQVEYFEEYCIGKTADEIAAIQLENQTATDDTILAGCTIKILGIQKAVVRACENAAWEGASASDTLSLGISSTIYDYNYSYDATAEKDGMVCASATFVAVTKNADDKITCAVLDAVQAKSTFDATGKITTDMESEPTTKYNLKEEYGMVAKNASPISKEWYEQAEYFMNYVVSTNAASINMDDSGKATDIALLAGCTITVSAMDEALQKALNPAY